MKQNISHIIKQNKWFLIPYVLFFLFLLGYIIAFDKNEGFLLLNPSMDYGFDQYFKFITYLGDGLAILALVFILLFFNRRKALFILSSFLLSGVITQAIKFINQDILRPSAAIGLDKVHKVIGVELHSSMSFPSGHTTAAFTIFFSLAVLINNKRLGLLCLLFAVLAGYSRIYLSQHFPIDVLVGSLIGTVSTLYVYHLFTRKNGI